MSRILSPTKTCIDFQPLLFFNPRNRIDHQIKPILSLTKSLLTLAGFCNQVIYQTDIFIKTPSCDASGKGVMSESKHPCKRVETSTYPWLRWPTFLCSWRQAMGSRRRSRPWRKLDSSAVIALPETTKTLLNLVRFHWLRSI